MSLAGSSRCLFDETRLQDPLAMQEAITRLAMSTAKTDITATLCARSAVHFAGTLSDDRYLDTSISPQDIETQLAILFPLIPSP